METGDFMPYDKYDINIGLGLYSRPTGIRMIRHIQKSTVL